MTEEVYAAMLETLLLCRDVLPTLIEDGDAARDREGRKLLGRVLFVIAMVETAARAESAAPERTTP